MAQALTARNESIVNDYKAGSTCAALAEKHGVSRERICQILRPHGVIEDKFAKRLEAQIARLERRYQKRQARIRLAEKMAELVRAGQSWRRAGEAVGIPEYKIATFRALLSSIPTSDHGRWRDFSERKERVRQMRAEGKTWEQINASFGRQIYPWVAKHMPELIRGRQ